MRAAGCVITDKRSISKPRNEMIPSFPTNYNKMQFFTHHIRETDLLNPLQTDDERNARTNPDGKSLILPWKDKRPYMLPCKVSRYCLLAW